MTIDEAITHAREVAEKNRKDYEWYSKNPKVWNDGGKKQRECLSCAEEHEQLAEWLEELKSYRVSVFSGDMTQAMIREERNKAIDDFLEKIQREYLNGCGIKQEEIKFLIAVSSQVAEQLKVGDGE